MAEYELERELAAGWSNTSTDVLADTFGSVMGFSEVYSPMYGHHQPYIGHPNACVVVQRSLYRAEPSPALPQIRARGRVQLLARSRRLEIAHSIFQEPTGARAIQRLPAG